MKLNKKKVLVTGADGFIGSHLTEMLLAGDCRVRALAQYNSFNFWGWLEDIPRNPNLEIITGDIRDPHFCREAVKGVDLVFNLAALIAIPYSYHAPHSYMDTNITGTLNICQAAREMGNVRVIHTSTSEVYGTAQYVPIDEKHPLQPQSPYSASKIGADAMAMSFFHAFSLPLTIARPFNTYGPRQSARAVIPSIIVQMANHSKKIRLGDTKPSRDFNYVEDTCQGFVELANCDEAIGEVVNIGSNREISILDTFNLIKELMDSDAVIESDEQRFRPENSEVFRLCCDIGKIRGLTRYQPSYSFRDGLQKTIAWFGKSENLAKYKNEIYNI
jgi:NAD dependent epimerase/dehydratase